MKSLKVSAAACFVICFMWFKYFVCLKFYSGCVSSNQNLLLKFTLKQMFLNFSVAISETDKWMSYFYFTFASPVVDELVSFITIAVVSDRSIYTFLGASTVVFSTLILATSISRFIFEVWTVWMLVTNFWKRNAHAATTVELSLFIANGFQHSCNRSTSYC